MPHIGSPHNNVFEEGRVPLVCGFFQSRNINAYILK